MATSKGLFSGSINVEYGPRAKTREQKKKETELHEVIDVNALNEILVKSFGKLQKHIEGGARFGNGRFKCHGAVPKVQFITKRKNRIWNRYLQCVCSTCGYLLNENTSHRNVHIECNDKALAVSALDLRWVIGCNALSVKCQGLNIMQSILNLPLTPKSAFSRIDKVVCTQKKMQCKEVMDKEIQRILKDRKNIPLCGVNLIHHKLSGNALWRLMERGSMVD